jgi:hypothetical protein
MWILFLAALAVMLHERAENGDFSSGSVFGVKQGKN